MLKEILPLFGISLQPFSKIFHFLLDTLFEFFEHSAAPLPQELALDDPRGKTMDKNILRALQPFWAFWEKIIENWE